MAEEFTYYAIINDFSSREQPAGVLRRIRRNGGERDETFGRDLDMGAQFTHVRTTNTAI